MNNGSEGYPQEPELLTHYEQGALDHLGVAELALGCAEQYAAIRRTVMVHPEFYEDTGLTDGQLADVTKMGRDLLENASQFKVSSMGKPAPRSVHSTDSLIEATTAYQGLATDIVINTEYLQARQQLSEELERPATNLGEFTGLIRAAMTILERGPYLGDVCTIAGLGVLRLARFFGQDDVQERAMRDPKFREAFQSTDPVEQAIHMAGVYFVNAEDATLLRNTLAETIFGSKAPGAIQLAAIETAITELRFTTEVRRNLGREKTLTAVGSVLTTAITQSSDYADLLIDLQPEVTELTDDDASNEMLLALEDYITQASKAIYRRASGIILTASRVGEAAGTALTQFDENPVFPVAEPLLRNHFEAQRAAIRAGELASARALRRESREQASAELNELLRACIVSRKALRKHAEGTRLTTLMTTGADGGWTWNVAPLSKDDSFDTAGLVVRLESQLGTQQNMEVFGRLFDAIAREDTLRASLGAQAPYQTIARPTAWLTSHTTALRQSPLATLKRVGDGYAAYRLAQRTSPDPNTTRRPARNVSVETLQRIEAFRNSAKPLNIRAFPPGRISAETLKTDARVISGESKGSTKLEEERLLVLEELSIFLDRNGYTEIQAFRLLPGSLKQRIPYYVLVLSLGRRKIIVAENPQKPNSTIVFDELNEAAATWQELVQLDKDAIRQFGGRAMRHNTEAEGGLDRHIKRVEKELVRRLLAA